MAIKTALTFGRTPMQMLLPEHTRGQIEELDHEAVLTADINLMMGWQVLKDETCPKCGVPSWIGHVADNWTQFEVRESICFSCEAMEQHEDEQRRIDKDNKRYGYITYVMPYRVPGGTPMPGRLEGLRRIAETEMEEYGMPGEIKPGKS